VADDHTLIPFKLEDQFGRTHTEAECAGRVTVVLGSDRAGSRYTAQWLTGVRDAMRGQARAERVRTFGVANVRGVPAFLRKLVTAALPKVADAEVLLDWDGRFATAYDFGEGCCTVLVADPAGRVVLRTEGREVRPEQVAEVAAALRALLADEAAGGREAGADGATH
jgi:predicted transcriptional regulator